MTPVTGRRIRSHCELGTPRGHNLPATERSPELIRTHFGQPGHCRGRGPLLRCLLRRNTWAEEDRPQHRASGPLPTGIDASRVNEAFAQRWSDHSTPLPGIPMSWMMSHSLQSLDLTRAQRVAALGTLSTRRHLARGDFPAYRAPRDCPRDVERCSGQSRRLSPIPLTPAAQTHGLASDALSPLEPCDISRRRGLS